MRAPAHPRLTAFGLWLLDQGLSESTIHLYVTLTRKLLRDLKAVDAEALPTIQGEHLRAVLDTLAPSAQGPYRGAWNAFRRWAAAQLQLEVPDIPRRQKTSAAPHAVAGALHAPVHDVPVAILQFLRVYRGPSPAAFVEGRWAHVQRVSDTVYDVAIPGAPTFRLSADFVSQLQEWGYPNFTNFSPAARLLPARPGDPSTPYPLARLERQWKLIPEPKI